jgi:hypothetical protein
MHQHRGQNIEPLLLPKKSKQEYEIERMAITGYRKVQNASSSKKSDASCSQRFA